MGGSPAPAPVPLSGDAAPAYVDAWRRSQLGTWKVVLNWQRTARGGHLSDDVRIAQRPPDRLAVSAGSVDARRGDRMLSCAAGDDGRLRCRDAGEARPYDDQVAAGERVLRDQLTGPGRIYDVSSTSEGCYQLRLRVPYPAPPYGRRASYCFDAVTGAPTLIDVERVEGRDRQQAVSVSARVDDADLAPPPGLAG
jgi:hypothetical protein